MEGNILVAKAIGPLMDYTVTSSLSLKLTPGFRVHSGMAMPQINSSPSIWEIRFLIHFQHLNGLDAEVVNPIWRWSLGTLVSRDGSSVEKSMFRNNVGLPSKVDSDKERSPGELSTEFMFSPMSPVAHLITFAIRTPFSGTVKYEQGFSSRREDMLSLIRLWHLFCLPSTHSSLDCLFPASLIVGRAGSLTLLFNEKRGWWACAYHLMCILCMEIVLWPLHIGQLPSSTCQQAAHHKVSLPRSLEPYSARNHRVLPTSAPLWAELPNQNHKAWHCLLRQ